MPVVLDRDALAAAVLGGLVGGSSVPGTSTAAAGVLAAAGGVALLGLSSGGRRGLLLGRGGRGRGGGLV